MCIKSKTYLAIYQTSKMGFFEKAFSGFKPITNSTESSALDFWYDPQYFLKTVPYITLYLNPVSSFMPSVDEFEDDSKLID